MGRMLITGVTGTLGTVLARKLLNQGHQVIGISRDEQKQRLVEPHPDLKLRLADIRDPHAVNRIVVQAGPIDHIYHLAALKCVDTLEDNPEEAIATNVLGTQNMLDSATIYRCGLTFTSTDKACYPVNAYGHSKALAEKMVLARGQTVCRYGNVLGSRGSFIPSLIKSLKDEGKAYITDPDMTRFWMTIDQAADFVIEKTGDGEAAWIPRGIKACSLYELVEAVSIQCGVKVYKRQVTGIRAGEKIHETLLTAEENDGLAVHSNSKEVRFLELELHAFIGKYIAGLDL